MRHVLSGPLTCECNAVSEVNHGELDPSDICPADNLDDDDNAAFSVFEASWRMKLSAWELMNDMNEARIRH